MHRFIGILLIWMLADLYLFQALKVIGLNQKVRKAYWLFEGSLAISAAYLIATGKLELSSPRGYIWPMVLLSLIPKLATLPLLFLEDLVRIALLVKKYFTCWFTNSPKSVQSSLISRKKFISQVVIGFAAVPFFGLIYGMTKGKYDYRVHRVKLKFKDLPASFDKFTITHLSDIHARSLDSRQAVENGVRLANAQNSDLILFTGDLINNRAEEMDDWISVFSNLSAPYGTFSTLGNHDYGDYTTWESEQTKADNFKRLNEVHKEMGFRLLLNENVRIEKDGQHIILIGVENWGKNAVQKPGDLTKATHRIDNADFKILMSHDPSHWDAEILSHEKHIHLTLAGHTHGMQFGIEVPGIKWSPIKYLYQQWAGLYQKSGKYIYVNRGFGFLGFPGRLGIWPEITVLTLESA
ncbi:metallophosphoesterase [Pedobacter sp. Leaf194]|uniref:metallophosphoesterase n=1 Tax=Pedobacter sp. Leaf194 TaxID=1736297 RepID=UPI000703BB80|nr:metallophosphoesterase [Pedobacter sp. Leaf194]KQS41800.1 hypothetical protein ASG14_04965 [Pedobacter sp. Leaf194]